MQLDVHSISHLLTWALFSGFRSWTFYMLSQNPAVEEALFREVILDLGLISTIPPAFSALHLDPPHPPRRVVLSS